MKLALDQRPQFLISSSLARSGLLAKAEGRAALKEWPDIWLAEEPIAGCRSSLKDEFRILGVRSTPEQNLKTGLFGLGF